MLNEKLEDSFGILDQIQRTYRNYNMEYVKIVTAYPKVMNDFFDGFEADIALHFKLHPTSKRQEI